MFWFHNMLSAVSCVMWLASWQMCGLTLHSCFKLIIITFAYCSDIFCQAGLWGMDMWTQVSTYYRSPLDFANFLLIFFLISFFVSFVCKKNNLLSLNAELLPQPDVLLVEVADLLHGEDGKQAGEQDQDDAAVQRKFLNLCFVWEGISSLPYIIGLFTWGKVLYIVIIIS